MFAAPASESFLDLSEVTEVVQRLIGLGCVYETLGHPHPLCRLEAGVARRLNHF